MEEEEEEEEEAKAASFEGFYSLIVGFFLSMPNNSYQHDRCTCQRQRSHR
jgi:hypothetical protein